MAVGTALVYAADLVPFELSSSWMVAAWIALPSIMALMIGGWVPHIYRSALRAAKSERETGELPQNRPHAQEDVVLLSNPTPRTAPLQVAAG
jgi:hypothetical protein